MSILPGVDVLDYLLGKVLDTANVVCDCHDISILELTDKLTVTGLDCRMERGVPTSKPITAERKSVATKQGLDVTGLRKLDLTYEMS